MVAKERKRIISELRRDEGNMSLLKEDRNERSSNHGQTIKFRRIINDNFREYKN